jgi:selenocysteine-specific elongation factor
MLESETIEALRDYHARLPLRAGMSREELKSRMHLSARDSIALLERLSAKGAIILADSLVRLPTHRVNFEPLLQDRVDHFLADLTANPFSPPALNELAVTYDLDDEVVGALVEQGRIVRVNETIAFGAEPFGQMRRRVVEQLGAAGTINVGEVRDMLDTTRKYALALLEYFDQQRLTRRVGDARVLR